MSLISLILQNVYENVHVSKMKSNYSEPKIYTGGIQISQWSKLTKAQRQAALSKDWYVYYSFRNPKTNKLKRQPNIKAGANRFKTKSERYRFLKVLQRNLSMLLQEGYSPYNDNKKIDELVDKKNKELTTKVVIPSAKEENKTTIKEAFDLALELKKRVLAETSYPKFKSKVNRFRAWLIENDFKETDDVRRIKKKTVVDYLNSVLLVSSARNRNNTRTDINTLFKLLEDNEIIKENFITSISKLKTQPKRNKTYKPTVEKEILQHLKQNDKILLLFIRFINYNFLRPIEICRLKIKDIDIKDAKIYLKAKNKMVKVKIIPEILIKELPDLSQLNPESFLFTPEKIGGDWDTTESNKRDYFTKRFKKIKDKFGLGVDYGLYSFRHTAITNLYRDFRKTMTPFEAKSKLKEITGHSTMTALEAYLRNIDAELPEDYSKHISN
ncbi:phage integrase family protein [Winogradskyella wandonensis]|uniref:Phage integrase family protein n=1 Tax=Winogradskyella wandonensis TaxID=1442586 RepID=A0A4R1KQB9_9FLAO|nr:site-specific integrase [Winogradskyella wandonensis]TCK67255.1 phage integrase family protein [Winogradskyella wandonensis]